MGKSYFTPEFFAFLKQLKRNNRREWFLKNKDRYEEVVRQPCLRFITDFGFRMNAISPWIVVSAKPTGGSLMRIYRDIRFSSDQSPYKTNVGMSYAGANESIHGAGYYLHFSPTENFLAGGAWHPDPRSLAKIRDAIAWKSSGWKKAKRGLALGGDSLSRAPRGYPDDHPMIEDLKRKDFIASIELKQSQVCGVNLLTEVTSAARQQAPLVGFLARAEGLQF